MASKKNTSSNDYLDMSFKLPERNHYVSMNYNKKPINHDYYNVNYQTTANSQPSSSKPVQYKNQSNILNQTKTVTATNISKKQYTLEKKICLGSYFVNEKEKRYDHIHQKYKEDYGYIE